MKEMFVCTHQKVFLVVILIEVQIVKVQHIDQIILGQRFEIIINGEIISDFQIGHMQPELTEQLQLIQIMY